MRNYTDSLVEDYELNELWIDDIETINDVSVKNNNSQITSDSAVQTARANLMRQHIKELFIKHFDGTSDSVDKICNELVIKRKQLDYAFIPDSVTSIGDGAFDGCSSLTSITIPNSVTSIGIYAFSSCSSLTSITIPDSVTSIGSCAFSSCSSLASINIGNGVTSIGSSAFEDCSSLASVTIGKGVTSIGNFAFEYCSSLTSITIPDSVTSIGSCAFYGCSKLASITIPDSVTSIGPEAFSGCSKLTSITIPDSVTSIGDGAFDGCSSLTSITIPNSVTSIGIYAFSSCSSLTSITIPDSVTSIGSCAFSSCSSLASINIGNGVKSIGSSAFSWCSSLASITIPDSVTSIGDEAFSGCSSLASINIGNGVKSIGDDVFRNCSSLKDIYYAGTKDQWDRIMIDSTGNRNLLKATVHFNYKAQSANQNIVESSQLSELWIDDIDVINDVSLKNAPVSSNTITNTRANLMRQHIKELFIKYFDGTSDSVDKICNELVIKRKQLDYAFIPDSVTSIGYQAFCYCSSLASITIPDSVTSIGSCAFYDCSSLASINIPDSVTNIGDLAFSYCSSLTSITIPDSVTSIGNVAFSWCSSLASITIPDSVTSIGNYAFRKCSSLESVTIGKSVTSIGNVAFSWCSSLTSINIGNGVKSIGELAFYGCSSLTSVNIPDSVTSIESRAFSGCSSLASINIGNGVKSIGDDVFRNCSSLKDIYYAGTKDQWDRIYRGATNNDLFDANIHFNYSNSKIVESVPLNELIITNIEPINNVKLTSTNKQTTSTVTTSLEMPPKVFASCENIDTDYFQFLINVGFDARTGLISLALRAEKWLRSYYQGIYDFAGADYKPIDFVNLLFETTRNDANLGLKAALKILMPNETFQSVIHNPGSIRISIVGKQSNSDTFKEILNIIADYYHVDAFPYRILLDIDLISENKLAFNSAQTRKGLLTVYDNTYVDNTSESL